MKLDLQKKPEGVKLILGFPGFGLVGTIATKFLIEHLDVEHIGCIESNDLLPLAAIHKSRLIGPLDIFYNKKHNLVILQTLSELTGFEWKVADTIEDLAEDLKVKEIIILDGVPAKKQSGLKTFYYTNKSSALQKLGLEELKEGVMIGVTATLLLKLKSLPISCVFSESHSQLPDSEAAARTIKVLDNYLGLKVDYKPLLKAAKKFEEMLKQLMEKTKNIQMSKYKSGKDDLSYLG